MGDYERFDLERFRALNAVKRAEFLRKLKTQHDRQAAGPGMQADAFKVLLGRFVGIDPGEVANYSMGKLLDLAYTRMLTLGAFTPAEEGMLKAAGFAERLNALSAAGAAPPPDGERPGDKALQTRDERTPGLDGSARLKSSALDLPD